MLDTVVDADALSLPLCNLIYQRGKEKETVFIRNNVTSEAT